MKREGFCQLFGREGWRWGSRRGEGRIRRGVQLFFKSFSLIDILFMNYVDQYYYSYFYPPILTLILLSSLFFFLIFSSSPSSSLLDLRLQILHLLFLSHFHDLLIPHQVPK